MNPNPLQQSLLDFASRTMELGVNWLLQSSLLIAAGLAIGYALRSRGSAVQSAVYRTTLVAALVCPLATWVLSLAGATGWSLSMPAAYEVVATGGPPVAEPVIEPTVPATDLRPSSFQPFEPPVARNAIPFDAGDELPVSTVESNFEPLDQPLSETSGDLPATVATGEPPVATVTDTEELRVHRIGAVAVAFAIVWIAASLLLLGRLAWAWRRLAELRRNASLAEQSTLRECNELATRMNVGAPEVLHSPFLPSPCLAGLRRPAVLLPDGAPDLPMRDVLIHELAHLARHDCHWNLLRRMATALFFFQPLLWKLSRRLEATAEEVCDDFVVSFGGNRQDYAHRLVDFAELSAAPMAAAGVGIVSFRTMLARRVTRILDSSRSLSTRAGHAMLALVLIGGLFATMLAGLVGIGPREGVAEAEAVAESETVEDAVEQGSEEEDLITVRGRVVDVSGRPVPGAKVIAVRSRGNDVALNHPHHNYTHEVVDEIVVDANGAFSIQVPDGSQPQLGTRPRLATRRWRATDLVAIAPGYTPHWISTDDVEHGSGVTLTLNSLPKTILGRLLNLEGQPMVGLRVRVKVLHRAEPEQVQKWVEDVASLRADGKLPLPTGENIDYATYTASAASFTPPDEWKEDRSPYFPAHHRLRAGNAAVPLEVQTKSDGTFELPGFGANQLAILEISGPGAAKHEITVITQDMERLSFSDTTYYGAEFDHVVPPGLTISGTVKDIDTGEPIVGATVTSYVGANSQRMIVGKFNSVTDSEGRYRLKGMPIGKGNQLKVVPADNQPYVTTNEIEVPESDGSKPVELNISLRRGVFITGRATEAETGEPVAATIHVHPYLDNPHARDYPNYDPNVFHGPFDDDERQMTGEDGSFRVVAPPGRNILAAYALDLGEYCVGLGADEITDVEKLDRGFATYDHCSPSIYNRLVALNLAADAESVTQDLTLSRGRTVWIRAVDSAGDVLRSVRTSNRTTAGSAYPESPDDELVQVIALRDGEVRSLLLLQQERRLANVTTVSASDANSKDNPIVVKLLPCGSVMGRLVNGDGEPVADMTLRSGLLLTREMGITAENVTTKEDGSFRFEYLAPNGGYRIDGYSQDYGGVVVVEDLQFQPGETIDLGTIDVTSKERPEPVRMEANAAANRPGSRSPSEDEDLITVRGQVVDPEGNPVSGADVYALRWFWDFGEPKPLAQVKADDAGRFEISYRKSQFAETAGRPDQWREVNIAAFADGFGPDWVRYRDLAPGEEPTIRLVPDDVPIEGRIIDLEGNPVAGATIEMGTVRKAPNEDLGKWIEAVRAGQSIARASRTLGGSLQAFAAGQWPEIISDTDGRFRLTGIGRERQVNIHVKGPTIVTKTLSVVTRVMDPVTQPAYSFQGSHDETNYGARFEYAAAPSRPIEGVVRDAETGDPIEGVEIWSSKFTGENISGIHTIKIKSDEQGRYRLEGMPKGEGNEILAVPIDLPYFTAEFDIPDPPGIEPIGFDMELHRGIWVTGRVSDKVTGDGVAARVYYMPFPDNQFAHDTPEFVERSHDAIQDRYRTSSDGTYRVVALPGRGVIGVAAILDAYPGGQGYKEIEGLEDRQAFFKFGGALTPGPKFPTAVKEVQLAENEKEVVCDFALAPGRRLKLLAVDPSGAPLNDVSVTGTREVHDTQQRFADPEIDIVAMRDDENRTVLLHHEERRLGKALRVTADQGAEGPITVKLEPLATVTGQLVDGVGEPVRGVSLRIDVDGEGGYGKNLPSTATDVEGRFRHEAFLPGLSYHIVVEGAKIEPAVVATKLEVQPGETIDLGTIDVTSEERPEPVRTNADAAAASEDQDSLTVRGQVIDNDGKPVANAQILATQTRWLDSRFVQNEQRQVGEARSGEDGSFAIEVPRLKKPEYGANRLSYFDWKPPIISAAAPGHTPTWLGGGEWRADHPLLNEVTLRLNKTSVPIHGRLVSLEGQPLAGLNVRVNVLALAEPGKVDEWLATVEQMRKEGKLPRASEIGALSLFSSAMVMDEKAAANERQNAYFPMSTIVFPNHPNYPPAVQTDSQGRFEIDGLPPDCLAILEISGDDVATQSVSVVTRGMERINLPGTGLLVGNDSNGYYGAEFDFPVAPGSTVIGTVRDAESGSPIVGVQIRAAVVVNRITYYRTKWMSVSGAEGEFRIDGLPAGSKKWIDVFPRSDQPYFNVEHVEVPEAIGDEPSQIGVKLRRGVFARGKVTDAETGEPVDATIHYHPFLTNENAKDYGYDPGVFRYDEGERYRTDEEGEFQAVVIPGHGILGVQAIERGTFCLGLGSEKIATQEDGRFAVYDLAMPKLFNRVVEIDVPEDAAEIEQDFTVSRGVNVTLKVQDPQGKPLPGVLASGLTSFGLHSNDAETDDLLEFKAMSPGETCRVLILHKERRLGRIEFVTAPKTGEVAKVRTVTLEPCGVVMGRVVDGEGAPVSGFQFAAHALPLRDLDAVTPQQVSTDSDGKFRFEFLPASASYRIGGRHQQFDYVELSKDLQFEPDEAIDLGTIDVTSEERPQPVQMKADAAANRSALKTPSEKEDLITVRGRVLAPDGTSAAGATVYADWVFVGDTPTRPKSEPSQKFQHEIVAQTKSDADGNYQLRFSKKSPREGWLSHGWHIAAFAPGMGPAWKRDLHVHKNPQQDLQLTRDQPILGRIVDLEGKPIAGVRVSVCELRPAKSEQAVLDWIADAKEKSPPAELSDYHSPSATDFSSRYPGMFPTDGNNGGLAKNSPALPSDVETDHEGRFQFPGLGANRLAILEIEGPSTAKCYLHVVSRDMQPLSAKPRSLVGVRNGIHYGREFEFVAEPTQVIDGTVTDADTGKPIAGILVRLGQFAESRFGQQDFLTTRTDENGRYRLAGAPQGGGHRIDVDPALDQPYFPTEKKLETESGSFDPIRCDFSLRQGKWIVGRVTDSDTNEPIVGATVEYLPLRSNENAKDYPNYRPEISGMVPSNRFHTTDDGSFRVLAIPGDGILAAIAEGEERLTYFRLDPEQVPEHLIAEGGHLNAYHPWVVTGYNALREVKLSATANEAEYDLELKRGLARLLRLVDKEGQPVTGVRVLGRTFPSGHLEEPLDDATVEVIGLRPDDERIVALVHAERRIGKTLTLPPGDEKTVVLEPCAVAQGRIVDDDGQPIPEVEVGVSIDHSDNWHRGLISSTTDADGQFEVLLPPGATYRVSHYTSGQRGLNISAECQATPGAVFELGDLTNDTELSAEETAKLIVVERSTKADAASPPNDTIVEYAGKVVTPDGGPAAQAKLFLVYHVNLPDDSLSPTWKPIGTTDAAGNFRIALAAQDLPGNEREWSAASLVATVDGFGFAWSSAAMHESSGKYLAKYRERLNDAPPEMRAHLEKTLAQAGQPIRLVRDEPITGRIVDINGQGVAGARLTLLGVWTGAEDDLSPWLEATQAERADYYSARMQTPRAMNGPQVRSLVTPAVTDADGRFTLRGVGREQIAELLVTGPDIQWEKIFARTQAGEPIELLKEWRSPDLGKYTYYPAEFTYVAGPSRPIVGLVRDRETEQPLAGVLIKSQHRHGNPISGWGQDFVRAKTGVDGRYRLEGMPIGDENRIAAIAGRDQAYLPMSKSADTRSGDKELEVNFDLPPAVWVEGQVTDKQSGEGLPGWVHYFIYADNPSLEKIGRPGMVDLRDRYQVNDAGRFRIPALPGGGVIGFTAFDHQKYPRAVGAMSLKGATRSDGQEIIKTEPSYLVPSSYHIVAEIDPSADAQSIELKLELDSDSGVKGRVVDPDGKPVTGYYFSGRLTKFATWDMARGDAFEIVGYDAKQPRPIYFVNPERTLAGDYMLEGDPPQELVVTLQPAGKVTGRIVDDNGEPLDNLMLLAWQPRSIAPSPEMAKASTAMAASLPPNSRNQSQWVTDDEGRFAIDGLAPGVEYRLKVIDRESMSRRFPPARMPRVDGGLEQVIVVEPGQTLELGDVRVVDEAKFEAAAIEGASKDSGASNVKTNEASRKSGETQTEKATIEIRGRVNGPDGKPVAGAQIFTPRIRDPNPWSLDAFEQVERARADESGAFQFVAPDADLPDNFDGLQVLAFAAGYGVAGAMVPRDAAGEESVDLTLQLVKDQAVRGRVVNTEGQPVKDLSVQATILQIPARAEQIDEFLNGWKQDWRDAPHRMQKRFTVAGSDLFARATTDADGRFEMRGLGADRVAWLQFSGAGMAQTMCFLVTRPGIDYEAVNRTTLERIPKEMRTPEMGFFQPPQLVGPDIEFIVEPGKSISGTVRVANSGEPIAGVQMYAGAGWDSVVTDVTDAAGRYRLTGLPKGQSQLVGARPPANSTLLADTNNVPDSLGLATEDVDFVLARGVVISGRVVDAKTREGVPGGVRFAPLVGNEYFDKPGYDGHRHSRSWGSIDRDGRFRLVTIPGPGLLLVTARSRTIKVGDLPISPYKVARLSPEDREHVTVSGEDGEKHVTTPDGSVEFLDNCHALKYLDNPPDDKPIECALSVEPGETCDVLIEDDAGQSLSNVIVAGMTATYPDTFQLAEPNCTLYALDPAQPRRVIFYHPQRRLGASLTVRGDETEPVVAKLAPTPVLIGRAVDEEGEPVADAPLDLWMQDDVARELDRYLTQTRAPMTTDSEGRFELVGILPGFNFRLALGKPGTQLASDQIGKGLAEPVDGTIDLGDVRVASEASRRAAAAKQAEPERAQEKTSEAAANDDALEIRGRVVGPDDQPVARAHVAIIGMKHAVSRGGDLDSHRSQTFAQATTDSSGRYRIVVDDLSSKTHEHVFAIASAEGLVVAWEQLNPDAQSAEVSFELQPEKIVEGRFVDIEGQPAAGVRMTIESIMVAAKDGENSAQRGGVGFRRADDPPPAWVQPITSDAEGRFAIHNVAANHGVFVTVSGNDRFAPQDMMLNSGSPEQRGKRDGTYRALVKNIKPGEEAVLPLAPAQIFEGVVRFEDTDEPAPYARLTIWASQQEPYGSMVSVAGKADAEGRYRISPNPGIRFGVTAYPPDGTPYLTRRAEPIRWQGGDKRRQVDVKLPRGVLVRGTVVESISGAPVADATVQYIPEDANNPHVKDDILTGWQGIQLTNESGEFEIVVLPGPGRLLVHGPRGEFVLKEISSRELNSGRPGGQRNYANAIERLDPELDAGPIDVRIEIERGAKVAGRIVDESGEPVDRALLITSLKINPASRWWRGFPIEAIGGQFELSGLAPKREYEVYFLDPKRQLGATVTLTAGMDPPVVVLQPCGQATARLVNSEGQPLQDFRSSLHMVVTPGATPYDIEASKRGELAANSDFVSNIDRANHWHLTTDNDGRITYPALIPGATYRYRKNEFSVRPGETFDLGEIEIDVND